VEGVQRAQLLQGDWRLRINKVFKAECVISVYTEMIFLASVDTKKAYENTYSIRAIGGGFSVSVPKEVVRRKAKEKGMSEEEFKDKFAIRVFYDDFGEIDGAFKFVEKKEE